MPNCGVQYVGQTCRKLKRRFYEHGREIKKKKIRNFLYSHFRKSGHSFKDIVVQPVEHIQYPSHTTRSFKCKARFIAELNWIKKLQTPYPLGLNDNIYQSGNISKDPHIDVFSIFSIKKRRSRSHGKRRNGNIKRKSRKSVSISELHTILTQTGRHAMLSRLTNLSISSLKDLDDKADNIYMRSNPYYKTAILIQSYTQHVLRPHIDAESDHKRHFIKIPFVNKGIDFIDIQSIFKNKNVLDTIPKYFKNTESPIICYKYNKPARGLIFNYNKIVTDLNITENLPNS